MFSRHECRVFSCLPTCGRGLQRYRKNVFTWHTHQPPICCFSTTMHQPFSGWHALNAQVRQVSCHAVLPFSLNNQWLIISSLLFFQSDSRMLEACFSEDFVQHEDLVLGFSREAFVQNTLSFCVSKNIFLVFHSWSKVDYVQTEGYLEK